MANWQRGVMRLMRITNHPVTVTAVHDYTPWYRRITFTAPDLVEQLEVFPTLWLRLWVPHPAKGEGHLSQRGYTFVDIRPDDGTFALDFVLHEESGPAGDWAKNAAPGRTLEAALTPARISLPENVAKVVLAGDTTALPAINTWIDTIPASLPVSVAIEDDHDDLADLPSAARENVTWTWVKPDATRGAALAAHLTGSEQPQPGLYAWAAGEKNLIKHVRSVFRDHLQLDRPSQFTQFYWIHGKATG